MDSLAGTPPPPGLEESLNTQQQGAAPAANPLTGAPPPAGIEDAIYSSIPQQALAGAEGVARGFSLGTSDFLARKLGYSTPEDIAARKATGAGLTGNIIGGAGLIGLTGGLAAPVEGALTAAEIAPLAARAIGYGLEGGVLGGSNAISDYALGDPHLNASKIAADVGYGALFGAGLGAASGALFPQHLEGIAEKANNAAETAEALSPELKEASGLLTPRLKANAPETIASADAIGWKSLPSAFISADKTDQNLYNTLIEGAPTFASSAEKNALADNLDMVTDKISNILDTGDKFGGGPLTKAQLGQALQDSFSKTIEERAAPLNELYDGIKEVSQGVNLPLAERTNISKEFLSLAKDQAGEAAESMANRAAKKILTIDNAETLNQYINKLGKTFSSAASPEEKQLAGQLADRLDGFFKDSITKAAKDAIEDPNLPEEAKNGLSTLLSRQKLADKQYAPFRENLNTLTEKIGRKNAGGARTAIAHIENLEPEDLVDRLVRAKGKYSNFDSFLNKEYEPQASLLTQYQKAALRDSSLGKDGTLNPWSVTKQIFGAGKTKGMEPEIRSSIFNSEELKDLENIHNVIKNIPESANPSKTTFTQNLLDFFKSPAHTALANVRDFGIWAYLKARSQIPEALKPNPFIEGEELAQKFNTMSAVQKVADDFDQKMARGAKSIFSAPDVVRGAALYAGNEAIDNLYKKASKGVSNLADNPSGAVDHVASHMGNLQNAIPNIVQSLNNGAMTAIQFLNSKMPRPQGNSYLDQKWEPSPAQKRDFMQYYNAVNDPLSVLSDVRNGTLTAKAMEAMQAVHPQLLKQMQLYVSGSLSSSKTASSLPYMTKIAISKLLGAPIDNTLSPIAIQANQAALSGPQLGNQQAPKMSSRRGSFKNFNPAQRAATRTQELEERKE